MTITLRPTGALLALALVTACSRQTSSTTTTVSGTPVVVATSSAADRQRWDARAANVTITRDHWGIAHVKARTDADAVFGMVYAQAEDDFNRVETNYLVSLGRLAQAEGEKAIWQDLRQRLYIDEDSLKVMYASSPAWLRALMDGWADGLNYYLATHPQVKPRAITRFEPWMPLSFSEGSIGGDIERISLQRLAQFYGERRVGSRDVPAPVSLAGIRTGDEEDREPRGSNGIAIAPGNTTAGRALLLINPHTSFFFRSELQMTSDEGLNAYGAVTWGQFFIYQGFNERLGWMHTSSGVDAVDEFLETVSERDGRMTYRYGTEERPVVAKPITLSYKGADGTMQRRTFTTYRTHHGPVVGKAGDRWVAFALMNTPVAALSQSWLRTKARNLAEYRRALEFKANSSNATLYADADGTIAYFHPQFIPRRDDRFDYTKPVDGSDPATDWRGLHELSEAPGAVNPSTGWVYNTNNWPYSMAGAASPKRADFPKYMEMGGENARGIHAIRVLEGRKDFSIPALVAAAYDPWLPAFATLVPSLVAAHDALPAGDARKQRLAEPIAQLRGWDHRWAANSVPTSLAVFWGEALLPLARQGSWVEETTVFDWIARNVPAEQKLQAFEAGIARLERDHGAWKTPWGEINRFQRLTGDIVHRFDDSRPSIPVAFTSAMWGSLASFGAAPRNGTKKWYGTSGNSFVAVVEFGKDSVRARAVTAGGESGDPGSKHFNDQAQRYAAGDLREVYFYPGQLQGKTERTYRPGER